MTRSFAIGLGIGTIRVIAVSLTLAAFQTRAIYLPSFWAGWGASLIAAELWVRAQRRRELPAPAASSAEAASPI